MLVQDKQTLQRGRVEKEGKMLIVFQLGIKCRMMSAGGAGVWMGQCFYLMSCQSALYALLFIQSFDDKDTCVQVQAGSA